MEVTEVRIKMVGDRDDKLRAFCTVTFDHCFVVRDLKIIRGAKGMFVAMPSRKLSDLCPKCGAKNHLRARFCNECGCRLNPDRAERDETGRAKLHADVAHPINQDYREELQRIVLRAYDEEIARSGEPDYAPPHDEFTAPAPTAPPGPAPAPADPPPAPAPDVPPQPAPAPDPPTSPPEPPPDSDDDPSHRFGEGILP